MDDMTQHPNSNFAFQNHADIWQFASSQHSLILIRCLGLSHSSLSYTPTEEILPMSIIPHPEIWYASLGNNCNTYISMYRVYFNFLPLVVMLCLFSMNRRIILQHFSLNPPARYSEVLKKSRILLCKYQNEHTTWSGVIFTAIQEATLNAMVWIQPAFHVIQSHPFPLLMTALHDTWLLPMQVPRSLVDHNLSGGQKILLSHFYQ